MGQFCIVTAAEIFEGNPFVNNPHLKHIEPFKTLYDRDKTDDKRRASNEFYAMFVMCSPDESVNKWIKLPEEERKEVVKKNIKIDWEDKTFKECLEIYPQLCMTIAEKTLKGIHDKLIERDKFLKESPYTMDYYMKDVNGVYVSRGNSFVLSSLPPKEIDVMIKNSVPLYKELSEAQKLFNIDKDNFSIKGQRRVTDTEDGTLWSGYDI